MSDKSLGELWSIKFCTDVHHVLYSWFGAPLPWLDAPDVFEVDVESSELQPAPRPSAITSATSATPTFVFDPICSPFPLVAHNGTLV